MRSILLPVATLLAGAVAGLVPSRLPTAEPEAWVPAGYTFELDVTVPKTDIEAWDAFTGDVSAWWDHRFTKAPKSLVIERKPGGSFVEVFDDAGHGAEHARVTHAVRGKMLRMVGPLGLVGHGVTVDATLEFRGDGEETQVKLVCHVHGKLDDELAKTVEGVWKHFLVDQYASHVRGG